LGVFVGYWLLIIGCAENRNWLDGEPFLIIGKINALFKRKLTLLNDFMIFLYFIVFLEGDNKLNP